MIPQRTARVAELLKREISNIIQQELHNTDLGFVSVTRVTVTKDLKQANIWISVLGDDPAKESSMKIINQEQYRIKELLAGKVRLRYLPSLHFRLDTSLEYNAHISDIISRLKKEEGWDKQ